MSIAMMNAALNADKRQELTAPQKFVLLLLANNANEEGIAFPSVRKMTEYSNLDDRTVQRAIGVLEEKGYITAKRRSGRSTFYYLHLLDAPGTVTGVESPNAQDAQRATNGQQQSAPVAAPVDRAPQQAHDASAGDQSGERGNPESPTPGTVTGGNI